MEGRRCLRVRRGYPIIDVGIWYGPSVGGTTDALWMEVLIERF